MIAQQELLKLLNLPLAERLQIAQRLIESALAETQPSNSIKPQKPIDEPINGEKIPFLSLAGMYSGGPGDTGERADEICAAEIKRRSGFTLKEELPE